VPRSTHARDFRGRPQRTALHTRSCDEHDEEDEEEQQDAKDLEHQPAIGGDCVEVLEQLRLRAGDVGEGVVYVLVNADGHLTLRVQVRAGVCVCARVCAVSVHVHACRSCQRMLIGACV